MIAIPPDFHETRSRELLRTRRNLRKQAGRAIEWLGVLGEAVVPFALGAVAFLPCGVLVVGVALWGGR